MYATQDDLIREFGERELIALTDRADPPAGEVDETLVEGALTDASAEMDAYIGQRYPLPLADVPQVLVRTACDIARYRLANKPDTATEEIGKRYEAALRFLRDVSKGVASLGVEQPTATIDLPAVSAPGRIMTRDTLRGF